MSYAVFVCPYCGKGQAGDVRSLKYTFKCRWCGKTRKLKKTSEWGLSIKIISHHDKPRDAADVVAGYNGRFIEKPSEKSL